LVPAFALRLSLALSFCLSTDQGKRQKEKVIRLWFRLSLCAWVWLFLFAFLPIKVKGKRKK
jgi:hypothetical protein